MVTDQDNDDAAAQLNGHRLAKPAHPGLFLRIEIIEDHQLSVSVHIERTRFAGGASSVLS